jgi:hypothetical protein
MLKTAAAVDTMLMAITYVYWRVTVICRWSWSEGRSGPTRKACSNPWKRFGMGK